MKITPELEAEIRRELRTLRAPIKVARKLGVDIRHVLPIADEDAGYPRTARAETHGGFGRPELREFIVGRKRAFDVWDNFDPLIARARDAYEDGTHEMVTGRDGGWFLLYSIPREVVTPRPDYFKPEF